MQLVEKIGSGIPRMAQLMKSVSLPEPRYSTSGMFVITITRPEHTDVTENDPENDTVNRINQLNNRQLKLLKILHDVPTATTIFLSQKLNVSRMTVHRDMIKLSELGIIKREGPGKSGKWTIIKQYGG